MSAQIKITCNDAEHAAIKAYAENNSLSIQQTIHKLLNLALDGTSATQDQSNKSVGELGLLVTKLQGCISELKQSQNQHAEDLENRIARVCAKGTKASLATLVATTTYLPPMANLTNSINRIQNTTWKSLGFEISNPQVAKDEAELLGWQGRSAQEFFDYCWSAGGRASKSGSKVTLNSITKKYQLSDADDDLVDVPFKITNLLDNSKPTLTYEDLLNQYNALGTQISDLLANNNQTGIDNALSEKLLKERRELRRLLIDRAGSAVSLISQGLILDETSQELWVKPNKVNKIDVLNYDWTWQELVEATDGEIDALVETLKKRLEQERSMPCGYDGSLDALLEE